MDEHISPSVHLDVPSLKLANGTVLVSALRI